MQAQGNFIRWWNRDSPPAGSLVWPQVIGSRSENKDVLWAATGSGVGPHLVTAGSGTFQNAHGLFQVSAGDMFFLWPGVSHRFEEKPEDPWSFDWVRVVGPGCEDFGRAWGASPENPIVRVRHPRKAREAFHALYDYFGYQERVAPEAVSLLFNLLAVTAPANTHSPGEFTENFHHLVRHAELIFETHLHEGININEVTQHLEVSRATLWRAFHEEKGKSPLQALQEARLQRARELLQRPDLKVLQVARLTGFRSEKYFQRWFRKASGSSPGQWRGNARGPRVRR